MLNTGNHTRFVTLHCFDTTGTRPVLSDAVLESLTLSYQGVDYRRNVSARAVRSENEAGRGFSRTGTYIIDMGDDEFGFLALSDSAGLAKLEVAVAATCPAGWTIEVHQDHTIGL